VYLLTNLFKTDWTSVSSLLSLKHFLLFSKNLLPIIIKLLYFSKSSNKFILKIGRFKLNIGPYNKLDKKVRDFKN